MVRTGYLYVVVIVWLTLLYSILNVRLWTILYRIDKKLSVISKKNLVKIQVEDGQSKRVSSVYFNALLPKWQKGGASSKVYFEDRLTERQCQRWLSLCKFYST